jgi:hypothetical protein
MKPPRQPGAHASQPSEPIPPPSPAWLELARVLKGIADRHEAEILRRIKGAG